MTAREMQKEIIKDLKRLDAGKSGYFDLPRYLGTQNKLYYLKMAWETDIAGEFIKRHKDITEKQFIELLDGLYKGDSFNERTFGTKLLGRNKSFKRFFTPERVFSWLGDLSGWAEVDSLCQSTFTYQDLLTDWGSWSRAISKMSRDKGISRRRASLVLLVKSVRGSTDERLANLAFENLGRLKGEKDILISKAVSWLLRELVKHHRDCVEQFLSDNKEVLPKFVTKEVSNKLVYGTKVRK